MIDMTTDGTLNIQMCKNNHSTVPQFKSLPRALGSWRWSDLASLQCEAVEGVSPALTHRVAGHESDAHTQGGSGKTLLTALSKPTTCRWLSSPPTGLNDDDRHAPPSQPWEHQCPARFSGVFAPQSPARSTPQSSIPRAWLCYIVQPCMVSAESLIHRWNALSLILHCPRNQPSQAHVYFNGIRSGTCLWLPEIKNHKQPPGSWSWSTETTPASPLLKVSNQFKCKVWTGKGTPVLLTTTSNKMFHQPQKSVSIQWTCHIHLKKWMVSKALEKSKNMTLTMPPILSRLVWTHCSRFTTASSKPTWGWCSNWSGSNGCNPPVVSIGTEPSLSSIFLTCDMANLCDCPWTY